MEIKIFSENGEELSDKEFNASNSKHKFIEIGASASASAQLKDILEEISKHDGEKDFTIACPKSVDPQPIQGFNVNDVTIIFTDSKYYPDEERSRKEFGDLITKTDILYRNKNFVDEDVIIHKKVAEEIQSRELLAAAYKFIAFEYRNENDDTFKPKYDKLDLGKIHSSFGDKEIDEVIVEADHAVCGGVYDKKKFNQAKEKSIYSGVDKFKASIDDDGYLVIQSVSDNIKDEHFQTGVKTNFKFEGFKGKEITQDNLSQLFTDDILPDGSKDSGLSVLGAIELAFQALKTIEKGNDGQLIKPNSSEQFNAIFPKYGEMRRVDPTLDFGAAAVVEVPEGATTPGAGAAPGSEVASEAPAPEPVSEGSALPEGSEKPATPAATVKDPKVSEKGQVEEVTV